MNHDHQHFLDITDEDLLLETGMGFRDISDDYMQEYHRKCIITREYYLGNQRIRQIGDRIEQRVRRAGERWRPQTTRNIVTQTIDPVWAIISGARPLSNIDACYPDSPVNYKAIDDEYMPLGLMGEEVATKSTELMDGIWNGVHRKESHAVALVVLDALLGGTSFRAYGLFDHPFRGTEIAATHLMSDQVYLDPEGRDLITFKDFRYIILKFNMDVATIKKTWNVDEMDYGTPNDNITRSDAMTSQGLFSRVFRGKGPPRQDNVDEVEEWSLRKYPVYFLYYAGHNPEMIQQEGNTGNQKFPNGRLTIWINDKKVVHDDEVKTRGFTFPIVGFSPNPVPHLAYGMSEAEKLLGVQDIINSFSDVVVSNVMLNGHTQLLVESGAIDRRNWSVSPGAILTAAKDALRSGRIQQLFPGPIGAEIINYMLNLEQFAKEEIGESNLTPPGTTSGLHARTIQEDKFSRHAFRIGLLDNSYEQCMFKEFSLTQQFVPLENNYYKGYFEIDDEMALAIQNLVFKVKLESRKDLPFSGAEQMNMYFLLAQQGYLTIEEFYELTKIPISQEWKEKVAEASKDARPGIPLQLQAQMELQEDAAVRQQGNLANEQLRGGGTTGEPTADSYNRAGGGGGGTQQGGVPPVPNVPNL